MTGLLSGRRRRAGDTVQIWITALAAGIGARTSAQGEAAENLSSLLVRGPQAAKTDEDIVQTCQALELDALRNAGRSTARVEAPSSIRTTLVTIIRRLRDAGDAERALAFVDILAGTGEDAVADRERMLARLESGDARGALEPCAALVRAGRGDLVGPVAEWMLVRLTRACGADGATALIDFLFSQRLVPTRLLEEDETVPALISALAAVQATGETAADPGDVEVAAEAKGALAAIEAAITEIEEPTASLELTRIRLLGALDRYKDAFQAMARYQAVHAISPGAATFFGQVMDRYLRARHSNGERMDLVAPLLDEAVFGDYLERFEDEEAAIWDAWPFARNLETALSPRPASPAEPRAPAALVGRDDPRTRVLIVSSNWRFISPLIEHAQDEAGADFVFRTVDFQSLTLAHKAAQPRGYFFFDRPFAQAGWSQIRAAAPDFADLVDWADVVMVEWANQPAVVLSQMLPPGKRLVVRLHSYEAFANWHYFIDWARVDETAFVAEHVRSIFFAQNRLARAADLKTSIVANRQDFDRPVPARDAEAKRTICMVGWATANKDPVFALETLKALREDGSDWRLRLVGGGWRPQADALEAEHRARFEAMLDDPDLSGAIDFVPHTDTPLEELAKAAYVISASHREGTHEAVVEGLAMGCIPVIRDWPMVARFGGARSQFADFAEQIVRTPAEAADLIRSSPWTRKGAEVLRRRARQAYGVERTAKAFKRFLKG